MGGCRATEISCNGTVVHPLSAQGRDLRAWEREDFGPCFYFCTFKARLGSNDPVRGQARLSSGSGASMRIFARCDADDAIGT